MMTNPHVDETKVAVSLVITLLVLVGAVMAVKVAFRYFPSERPVSSSSRRSTADHSEPDVSGRTIPAEAAAGTGPDRTTPHPEPEPATDLSEDLKSYLEDLRSGDPEEEARWRRELAEEMGLTKEQMKELDIEPGKKKRIESGKKTGGGRSGSKYLTKDQVDRIRKKMREWERSRRQNREKHPGPPGEPPARGGAGGSKEATPEEKIRPATREAPP